MKIVNGSFAAETMGDFLLVQTDLSYAMEYDMARDNAMRIARDTFGVENATNDEYRIEPPHIFSVQDSERAIAVLGMERPISLSYGPEPPQSIVRASERHEIQGRQMLSYLAIAGLRASQEHVRIV